LSKKPSLHYMPTWLAEFETPFTVVDSAIVNNAEELVNVADMSV